MKPNQIIRRMLLLALFIFSLTGANQTFAQVGTPLPNNAPLSDQKLGSVLLFNYFKSSSSNPAANDTLISLTNTHSSAIARLAFYSITIGRTEIYTVCLAPNQSSALQMSHFFPGETGALMVVAIDAQGFPLKFNFLRGNATIKFSPGYTGSYNAIAIAKLTTTNPPSPVSDANATPMNFDGVSYNQLPAVLAVDHVPSIADGNETIYVLNQWGGNLASGFIHDTHGYRSAPPDAIGSMLGTVYSPNSQVATWSFSGTSSQYLRRISDSNPSIPGGMSNWIPTTFSGWMKFQPTGALNNRSFTGLAMYYRANANTTAGAFVGIRNLPHFTLTTSIITIPRVVPNC